MSFLFSGFHNMSDRIADERNRLRADLLGEKKHKELDIQELHAAGRIFFGDPGQLSLYGMAPADLLARGCRILGRTAIECKIDAHCSEITSTVHEAVRQNFPDNRKHAVVDLFMGSGNLLYQIASTLSAGVAIGYETDELVFGVTSRNFKQIGFNATQKDRPFDTADSALVPDDHVTVILIDPPWGDAFRFDKGLDLGRTQPPVRQIFADSIPAFSHCAGVLLVVIAHESTDEQSVDSLAQSYPLLARGDTSTTSPGSNVGYLILSGSKMSRNQ